MGWILRGMPPYIEVSGAAKYQSEQALTLPHDAEIYREWGDAQSDRPAFKFRYSAILTKAWAETGVAERLCADEIGEMDCELLERGERQINVTIFGHNCLRPEGE